MPSESGYLNVPLFCRYINDQLPIGFGFEILCLQSIMRKEHLYGLWAFGETREASTCGSLVLAYFVGNLFSLSFFPSFSLSSSFRYFTRRCLVVCSFFRLLGNCMGAPLGRRLAYTGAFASVQLLVLLFCDCFPSLQPLCCCLETPADCQGPVSYTHLRAHET